MKEFNLDINEEEIAAISVIVSIFLRLCAKNEIQVPMPLLDTCYGILAKLLKQLEDHKHATH